MNKIILYIATSLDGFIADINGGVDWLPHPKDDAELEAVGYKDLMERIDTILMGSRSYKQILSFGDWGWPPPADSAGLWSRIRQYQFPTRSTG